MLERRVPFHVRGQLRLNVHPDRIGLTRHAVVSPPRRRFQPYGARLTSCRGSQRRHCRRKGTSSSIKGDQPESTSKAAHPVWCNCTPEAVDARLVSGKDNRVVSIFDGRSMGRVQRVVFQSIAAWLFPWDFITRHALLMGVPQQGSPYWLASRTRSCEFAEASLLLLPLCPGYQANVT
ncbi:hypothetical protein ACJJTC_008521 [Scirpophaga incertulas]